jgi:hypothetical protein
MRFFFATAVLALAGCASILNLDAGEPLTDASAPPNVADVAPPVDSRGPDAVSGGQDAGCGVGMKSCGPGVCASTSDPSAGCGAASCSACSAPNATSFKCSGPDCAVGTCAPRFADCNNKGSDGCEVDTRLANNCQGCGIVCDAGMPLCTPNGCSNSCSFTVCPNGACVDTRSDSANCGACSNKCPNTNANARCDDGGCTLQCFANFAHCSADPKSGCETDLSSTTAHCGSCTQDCSIYLRPHETNTCYAGNCTPPTCVPPWNDCDGDPTNGCETNGTCPVDAGSDTGFDSGGFDAVGTPDVVQLGD